MLNTSTLLIVIALLLARRASKVFALLVSALFGYLIGGFPSAALLARLNGKSIFTIGSGNMGAMNTVRNVGVVKGVLVLLADIGKGSLATFLGMKLASLNGATDLWLLAIPLVAGATAVVGHGWSPYIGLKGGKGLSTTLGVGLPLYPIAALFGLITLITIILVLRRVNLASTITIGIYPLIVLLVLIYAGETSRVAITIFCGVLLLGIIGIIKHMPSLQTHEPTLF